MKKGTATVLGLVVAPIIPAVYSAIATPITRDIEILPIIYLLPVFYLYALVATVVLGLPSYLLVQRLRLVRWWSVLLVGIAIGAVVAVLIRLQTTIHAHDFLVTCPLGAASALTFWFIWKCGNESNSKN